MNAGLVVSYYIGRGMRPRCATVLTVVHLQGVWRQRVVEGYHAIA
jgi:hypothetical protein